MTKPAAAAKSGALACSPTPQEPAACGEHRSRGAVDTTVYQPFPDCGALLANMDLPKPELVGRVGELSGTVRSYKIISVELDDQGRLAHFGSGPNFQGGCLTLCTCAHQIRTEKLAADWMGRWVAGFTSPRLCTKTWLFYLARVEAACPSAADMWNRLCGDERQAKSTRLSRLGDAFQPNPASSCGDPYRAAHYHPPMVGHSHRSTASTDNWKKDIEFRNAQFGRHAAYLVADPEFTFLWQTPTLFVENHPRNQSWASVNELLQRLSPGH